jgi:hypothetical protein
MVKNCTVEILWLRLWEVGLWKVIGIAHVIRVEPQWLNSGGYIRIGREARRDMPANSPYLVIWCPEPSQDSSARKVAPHLDPLILDLQNCESKQTFAL